MLRVVATPDISGSVALDQGAEKYILDALAATSAQPDVLMLLAAPGTYQERRCRKLSWL